MNPVKHRFDDVKDYMKPLEPGARTVYSQRTLDYFRYYGLQYEGAGHEFGTFRFRDYSLAAHIFTPGSHGSVVLLMHGYLDHAGLHSRVIGHLLSRGFAVAACDMPGHGLSTGEPCGIDSFSTYSSAMEEFMMMLKRELKVPVHLIGHSTGGAAVIDHLLTKGGEGIGKVVLAAPLVRSYLWDLSRYSYGPLSLFMSKVPRVFRRLSSDKAFVDFNRRDPLQAWSLPMGWVKALIEWNGKIEGLGPCGKKIAVLQGMKDTVVEWKYNMGFMEKKFPAAEIMYFRNANHQLFNEAEAVRSEVFKAIDEHLAG